MVQIQTKDGNGVENPHPAKFSGGMVPQASPKRGHSLSFLPILQHTPAHKETVKRLRCSR